MSIKKICYSSHCEIVQAGFQEQFWSCRYCKMEVTTEIKDKWELEKAREKKRQEDKKKREEENDDKDIELWSML